MPDYSDRLLTPDEAARVLRCARQTLARWRYEGGGPVYVKVGARVLYRRADLEAWIAGRRVVTTGHRPTAA
jgi:excisionase family DNA binding protein